MPFDEALLRRSFGHIWPAHVDGLAELLIALRRHFHGDLDLLLVLAVIGSRTLHARRVQGVSFEEFSREQLRDSDIKPINIQSVSDCTGIPRETVRRKVSRLEEIGWIDRRTDGSLAATAKAREELAPATEDTFRYLAALTTTIVDAAADS